MVMCADVHRGIAILNDLDRRSNRFVSARREETGFTAGGPGQSNGTPTSNVPRERVESFPTDQMRGQTYGLLRGNGLSILSGMPSPPLAGRDDAADDEERAVGNALPADAALADAGASA